MKIGEFIEKVGVKATIGCILVLIAIIIKIGVSEIKDVKNLGNKDIIILVIIVVGSILIISDLLSNKNFSNSNIKLVGDPFDYPDKIERAIYSQLFSRNFYKEEVEYNITVNSISSDGIVMTTELSYDVVNRTDRVEQWSMEYKYKNSNGEILKAKFDNQNIDETPDVISGRGAKISREMNPKQKSKVYFKVRETFRKTDFELYTSYYPATDMNVIVNNTFANLKFDYEILYFSNIQPETSGNGTKLKFRDGLLPHQGVRINWKCI